MKQSNDWKLYEGLFYRKLQEKFPFSEISFNQDLIGKYSKTRRQIDILVTHYLMNEKISIAFDCKYYSKKLNVKHVETIIGMFQDLDISKGVIVTNKGYSRSSFKRVANDPNCALTLEISTLDDIMPMLDSFSMMFKGVYCVFLTCPSSWKCTPSINQIGVLSFIHKRETVLVAETDFINQERPFIYGNIAIFDKSLDDFLLKQDLDTRFRIPESIIIDWNVEYAGTQIYFRKINYQYYPIIEYTIFIPLDEKSVFYLVLVDNIENEDTNTCILNFIVNNTYFFKKVGKNIDNSNANITLEEALHNPIGDNYHYQAIFSNRMNFVGVRNEP